MNILSVDPALHHQAWVYAGNLKNANLDLYCYGVEKVSNPRVEGALPRGILSAARTCRRIGDFMQMVYALCEDSGEGLPDLTIVETQHFHKKAPRAVTRKFKGSHGRDVPPETVRDLAMVTGAILSHVKGPVVLAETDNKKGSYNWSRFGKTVRHGRLRRAYLKNFDYDFLKGFSTRNKEDLLDALAMNYWGHKGCPKGL